MADRAAPSRPLTSATAPCSLARAAASLGLRRVELVRVTVRPTGTVAEAVGVVHRYPRTLPIPMSIAARLVAAGARLRIEHDPFETEG